MLLKFKTTDNWVKRQFEQEKCGVCTDYMPMTKDALCTAIHLTLPLIDNHFPHFFLNLVVLPPNLFLCNTTQHQAISQLLRHLAHLLNITYSTHLGSSAMSYGEGPRAVSCCLMEQQIAVHQLYNDHGEAAAIIHAQFISDYCCPERTPTHLHHSKIKKIYI